MKKYIVKEYSDFLMAWKFGLGCDIDSEIEFEPIIYYFGLCGELLRKESTKIIDVAPLTLRFDYTLDIEEEEYGGFREAEIEVLFFESASQRLYIIPTCLLDIELV
jgi:hypothetical protein